MKRPPPEFFINDNLHLDRPPHAGINFVGMERKRRGPKKKRDKKAVP